MTFVPSRELVLKKLESTFPDPVIAEQALRSLDRYNSNKSRRLRDYVHLAILKLSEGELWRLRELVREAKHDPRDVLYPAEAPEYFKWLRSNPLVYGGPRPKTLSKAKEAAMQKRDRDQWIAWLSSDET
ncbi:MAG: hypothetical protein ABSH08_07095 [Tepidisphaeraceae bacterium]|jgi:hypothetical protein